VKTYLGDHDLGDGLTTPRYLARLAAEATTIVNAPDYARMVSELHARRALIGVAAELEAQAHDPPVGTCGFRSKPDTHSEMKPDSVPI
jgi:replicative DNA helicase